MDNRDINLMDDEALIWACIGPAIIRVRGKAFDAKSEAYGSLTRGQRALFMFQVMHGHIGSGTADLLDNLSYLLCKDGVWGQLKSAFEFFGDNEMAGIARDMERLFILKQNNGIEIAEVSETISAIDKRLFKAMPETIKLIAGYIRNNQNEFMPVKTDRKIE